MTVWEVTGAVILYELVTWPVRWCATWTYARLRRKPRREERPWLWPHVPRADGKPQCPHCGCADVNIEPGAQSFCNYCGKTF